MQHDKQAPQAAATETSSATEPKPRREQRRPVVGLARMMQKTRLILDEAGQDVLACKILDASDHGYRVGLTQARKIEGEITLEHTDGSQRRVRVCWARGNELGLEIVEAATPARR